MTDFFNIAPKKRKRLAKAFSWFTILSLILQIGSGVLLARPAFAEEETTLEPEEVVLQEEPVTPSEEQEFTEETVAEEPESSEEPTGEEETTSDPVVQELTPTPPAEQTGETEETEEVEQTTPSVSTDKPDYAPGETVKITGENFPANTTLIIKVTRPDGIEETGEVISDGEGKIGYDYQLNGIEGEYLVEIFQGATVLATTRFTDTPPTDGPGASECAHAEDCTPLDNPGNSGSYQGDTCLDHIVIKAGSEQSGAGEFPYSGDANDGCYLVDFLDEGTDFDWARIGDGPSCKDISHIQIWFGPCPTLTPTPTPEPYCGDEHQDPGEECDDGNNQDGDGCSATCQVEPPLCPFTLRKDVLLYWEGENIQYSDPDTEFTVEIWKGDQLLDTIVISESSPAYLQLEEGSYSFCETGLPEGYLSAYGCINYTTGEGYPDWTHINVITFDLGIVKDGPETASEGETITYNYEVINAGPASVTPVIDDDLCSPVAYVSGDTNGNSLIDPDETWLYECDYEVLACEENETITNTAIVYDQEGASRAHDYWWLGGDRDPENNQDSHEVKIVEAAREITACKYADYDGDGERDEGEPGIEGVTMTLEKWTLVGEWPFDWLPDGLTTGEPDFIGWEWQEVSSGDTGEDGCYTFGGLPPGRYRVSEDLEDLPGYTPTSETSYEVLLEICGGQSVTVSFFNQPAAEISLELTKENSVSGSTVTYTLKVINTSDAIAFDVHVKDQLPSGFSYNTGTTKIDGSPAADPSISGQELTWSLPDLAPDRTVVLTYEVTIGDLPDGTYPNVAVAWGGRWPGDPDVTYSNFAQSGVGIFHGVSTTTHIGGVVLGISKEVVPEVLGAATGSETYWLILALIMILVGITIRLLDEKRKAYLVKKINYLSKRFSIVATIALLFLVTAGTVWAINSLFIRVAQLPEYKRTDNFKLYYTALEREDKPITVDCYVRKDGGFSWKTFGGTQTDPSGFCEAFGHDLEGDATYHFKAIATSEDGSTESNETHTTVDRVAPNGPGDYRKSRESGTSYKIHFKNPGELDYGWTRIFASQTQNFTADDATKKADVGGGPNQEFDYVVGGLEPDKEYYFALQGFDKAGNGSGLSGDGGSVTYVEEEILGEGIGGGTMDWGEAGLLPKEKAAEEAEEGEILGGITEEVPEEAGIISQVTQALSKANRVVWAVGLVILAGLAYIFYRRSSSE